MVLSSCRDCDLAFFHSFHLYFLLLLSCYSGLSYFVSAAMPIENSKRSRPHHSKHPRVQRGVQPEGEQATRGVQPEGERAVQIRRFKGDLGLVVSENNPLRVIFVGDDHLRFAQVGYSCSKARHHIGHGFYVTNTFQRVPVVKIPPKMEVDQVCVFSSNVREIQDVILIRSISPSNHRLAGLADSSSSYVRASQGKIRLWAYIYAVS